MALLLDRKVERRTRIKLHPDLAAHVYLDPRFGRRVLDHPLLKILPFDTRQRYPKGWPWKNCIDQANQNYAFKIEALEDALLNGDWGAFVFLHERPYRVRALMEAIEALGGNMTALWPLVADVWTDSENIHQFGSDWREIWTTRCKFRHRVMQAYERKRLATLPDELSLWRGVSHPDSVQGMSWTLDQAKAEWFARRFAGSDGRKPLLVSGTVKKTNVLAYFSARREREIVVLPENVTGISVEQLQAMQEAA